MSTIQIVVRNRFQDLASKNFKLRHYRCFWLVAFVAFFAAPASAGELEIVSGEALVTDGDTLEIGSTVIRIAGIDAPEIGQMCADAQGVPASCDLDALTAIAGLVAGRKVVCVGTKRDRYGRLIATCEGAVQDIGREMVKRGLAVAYRRYSERYTLDEDDARAARRGIWAGEFVEPEAYRKGKRK
jgi:endonuclease YncB( thermonuclease family)